MTCLDKFKEPLPPKAAFYSSLYEDDISDEDYEFVQQLYSNFKMKNLGDLHDIYVRSDTALLADVMLNLRNLLFNQKEYALDLCHYFSIPMLSFDCMLKFTESHLELLSDVNMYCYFESGIRGGYCGAQTIRYAEANNKYMPNYDPKLDSSYIMYVDANNLVSLTFNQVFSV